MKLWSAPQSSDYTLQILTSADGAVQIYGPWDLRTRLFRMGMGHTGRPTIQYLP